MNDKVPPAIELRDLKKIAFDLRLAHLLNELLILKSDADETRQILKQPFRAKHYSLIFVEAGKLHLRVNMFDYEITPGTVAIVTPTAIKEFEKIRDDTRLTAVLFTEKQILGASFPQVYRDFFSQFVTNSHFMLQMNETAFEELRALSGILYRRIYGSSSEKVINLLLLTLLNVLGESIEASDMEMRETKNKKADLVVRFFKLLPKNIAVERGVQFYADTLKVNEKYLTRTLKEKTGRTALQLISEMVVLEAKVLLSNPDYSIFEIAEHLSFPDQFTFSKYFKRYSGITPSRYRDQAEQRIA